MTGWPPLAVVGDGHNFAIIGVMWHLIEKLWPQLQE